jgi:hypothetical protein
MTNKFNYFLDLPEDIQNLIYRFAFNNTLKELVNTNNKSLYDFYDIQRKSKLCYCITNADDIYLHRKYYTLHDPKLLQIKYIEFPTTYFTKKFKYIKRVLEDFAFIIYNDNCDYRQNVKLQRINSGIYNVQYKNNSFRIFIDKNKLLCKVDLEKAIFLGYELLYYSLKLISILKLNPKDDFEDINGLHEWFAKHRYLDGYVITNYFVNVELGS